MAEVARRTERQNLEADKNAWAEIAESSYKLDRETSPVCVICFLVIRSQGISKETNNLFAWVIGLLLFKKE